MVTKRKSNRDTLQDLCDSYKANTDYSTDLTISEVSSQQIGGRKMYAVKLKEHKMDKSMHIFPLLPWCLWVDHRKCLTF